MDAKWWRIGLAVAATVSMSRAEAALLDSPSMSVIEADDVAALMDPQPAGSGLGLLDLVLLAPSGFGSLNNPAGALNFDNSNTNMPTGASANANESYVTSVGELRDFYRLNFPDGSGGSMVSELLLFAALQEAGAPGTISLDGLDLAIDYSVPSSAAAQDPAANDVTATIQNAINGTVDTGTGTRLVSLVGPLTLQDVRPEGADVVLASGWNPFDPSLSDGTRLMVHWTSSQHDSAGESLFLSGALAPHDVCGPLGRCGAEPGPDPDPELEPEPGSPGSGDSSVDSNDPVVPEPSSLLLSFVGAIGLFVRRR
jgi:hypothetical protein